MASYLCPTSLTHPLAALQADPRTVLASGTDHLPALAKLRRITRTSNAWRIPALTTWTGLIAAGPPPLFDGLRDAARQVGTSPASRPATSRRRWTPGARRRMLCAAAP